MVIGEPFAEFVLQHYPSRARRITQEEACDILEMEDARGRVHHAFFSEMMLGRFFAICNCCSCCCTAIIAHQNGTPMIYFLSISLLPAVSILVIRLFVRWAGGYR
jgi:hypothetical protein